MSGIGIGCKKLTRAIGGVLSEGDRISMCLLDQQALQIISKRLCPIALLWVSLEGSDRR
jgi:hypothetical protein